MVQKKTPQTDGSDDTVRLPHIAGISPGKYLTFIYALALAAILFFLLVFPGLVNPGALVAFSSEPSGAAVRVDDVYFGTTPCDVFVREGKSRFDVVLPGFVPFNREEHIAGRVFASLVLPRKLGIHAELAQTEPLAALVIGAREAAEWSFAGESAETYQTPLALSEGAYRSAPKTSEADALLKAAARFTSTRAALKDLLRAKFLADNGGNAPSPLNAVSTAADILAFLADNPAFTAALPELLGEAASPLLESAWYRKNVIDAVFPAENAAPDRSAASFGTNLTVNGVSFVEVEGGTFKAAADFRYETPLTRYYIAANEVSSADWSAFLAENPEWRKQNAAALAEQGLTDALYLVQSADGPYPDTAAGVSWFAADADCRWLTTKLPSAFSDWLVRLPSEVEWEYAAKGAAAGRDGGRLNAMFSARDGASLREAGFKEAGLWEWCADYFVPLYFLDADGAAVRAVGSPQRGVRGGCWVNAAGSVTPETRAGLPPSSCSPFVSFRPVIARAQAEGAE
jgi:formylglycine-generating enzyme required for sulfatase activity